MTATKHAPVVYWYPTFLCNLACRHCSVHSSPRVDTSLDLSTDEALDVVGQIKELGCRTVIMSGGEVLIRKDILIILRALFEAGVNITFESNGLLFTDEFADLITWARDERGLRTAITVSVDGGTATAHDFFRGRNAFHRTVSGLRFLKARGIAFDVQCVLSIRSIDTIPDLFALAAGLAPGLQHLTFTFLNAIGRGEALHREVGVSAPNRTRAYAHIVAGMAAYPQQQVAVKVPPALIPPEFLSRLFAEENSASCITSCAFPTLGVLADGRVTICALTRMDTRIIFGNVRTGRLLGMWEQARLDSLRQRYLDAELEGICGSCRFRQTCKGCCRAHAFEESGSFDAAHPLCQYLDERGEFPAMYRTHAPVPVARRLRLPIVEAP
jgi:radical SAM protein with 4Fe4S-binding SPASM domain